MGFKLADPLLGGTELLLECADGLFECGGLRRVLLGWLCECELCVHGLGGWRHVLGSIAAVIAGHYGHVSAQEVHTFTHNIVSRQGDFWVTVCVAQLKAAHDTIPEGVREHGREPTRHFVNFELACAQKG